MSEVVLVVEDEPALLAVARQVLTAHGYRVAGATSAEAALEYLKGKPADLVLCDIQLPGMSGLALCEDLKRRPETAAIPVILVTVLGKTSQKVAGLKQGADDYIAKPYDPNELVARVQAVLRRARPLPVRGLVLSSGPVSVDLARHEVRVGSKPVSLRRKEFELLVLFLRKPGLLLTRAALTAALWDEDVLVTPNALEVHVRNLRRALGRAGAAVETVTGEGYRWRARPPF